MGGPPSTSASTPISPAGSKMVSGSPAKWRNSAIAILCVAIAGWVGALATLVLTTANPPTVNPLQVRSADAIVVVSVSPEGRSNFQIVEVLFARDTAAMAAGETISIRQLPATVDWSVSKQWILAVTRSGGTWEVCSGVLSWDRNGPAGPSDFMAADVRPVVYPDSEAVRGMIQRVVKR